MNNSKNQDMKSRIQPASFQSILQFQKKKVSIKRLRPQLEKNILQQKDFKHFVPQSQTPNNQQNKSLNTLQDRLNKIEGQLGKDNQLKQLNEQINQLKKDLQQQDEKFQKTTQKDLQEIKAKILAQVKSNNLKLDGQDNFSHQNFYQNHFDFLKQIQNQNIQHSEHQGQIQATFQIKIEQLNQYQSQMKIDFEHKINELAEAIQEIFQENHMEYQEAINDIHDNLHENIQEVQDNHEEFHDHIKGVLQEHHEFIDNTHQNHQKNHANLNDQIQSLKTQVNQLIDQQENVLQDIQAQLSYQTQDGGNFVPRQVLAQMEKDFDLKIENMNQYFNQKLVNQNQSILKLNNNHFKLQSALNDNSEKNENPHQTNVHFEEASQNMKKIQDQIDEQFNIIIGFNQKIKHIQTQLQNQNQGNENLHINLQRQNLIDSKIDYYLNQHNQHQDNSYSNYNQFKQNQNSVLESSKINHDQNLPQHLIINEKDEKSVVSTEKRSSMNIHRGDKDEPQPEQAIKQPVQEIKQPQQEARKSIFDMAKDKINSLIKD